MPSLEKKAPEVSICAPLYKEEAVVTDLCQRVRQVLDKAGLDWELVLVDDGSSDRTWELVRAECQQDPRVRGVRLSRNYGLQAAATCALRHCRGRAIVLMDGDLQDPPEMIPEMIAHWREGAEIVYTLKTDREEPVLRKLCFSLFHRLFRKLAGNLMMPNSGLFSLMSRRAVDAMLAFREQHRYLPGLRFWIGFRQDEMRFCRPPRSAGEPKQNFRRLFGLALDALLSFSKLPLRAATVLGLAVSLLSFLGMMVVIGLKVYSVKFAPGFAIPGWASYMSAISFFGGVQLLFLGIIGEYVGRIYDEVKGRPLYLVAEEFPPRSEEC